MRTRDDRRNALNLAKREARNKLRRTLKLEPTPRQIGAQATVHNTCPCWMCTEKEPLPLRRMRADLFKLYYRDF